MASSSSEDSLLELLELLVLLIVCWWSVPVGLGGLPERRRGRPAAGDLSVWKTGCRSAAVVVAQRNAGGVQRQLLAETY